MEATARQQLVDIQLDLIEHPTPLPAHAREIMVTAGYLYGLAMADRRVAEALYTAKRAAIGKVEPVAARVTMLAEATKEFHDLGTAEDTVKLALAVNQQAKLYVRSLDEEMRLAR